MGTKFVKETTRTTTTTQTVASNGSVSTRVRTATSVRLVEVRFPVLTCLDCLDQRGNAKQQELASAASNGCLPDAVEVLESHRVLKCAGCALVVSNRGETDYPESDNAEIWVKLNNEPSNPQLLEAHLVLPVLKNIGATSIDIADADAHLSNVSETPYDPLAMTTLGLPLSFVHDLIKESGGSEAFKNLTTTDVCQKLVQPLTAHTRRSMIDTLIIEGRSDVVSDAKWFVSHAWKYQFLEVIDALTDFAGKKGIPAKEFIIWFDLFSNSQHETANKPFEWWENTFMSAIKKMGQVVMVLIPWSDPIPLTRAWCIFEIYSTVKTGSVFDVAMPSHNQAELIAALRNNPSDFYGILAKFESRNAEATNPVDKDRIFQVIAETVGFHTLDKMVLGVFRDWTESLMSWFADTIRTKLAPEDTLLLQWSLASLYRLNGKRPLAFELHRSVYQDRLKMLGPDHIDTLVSMNSMIECALEISYSREMKSEADCFALMKECLATAKRALGVDHTFTLLAMYNMASIYLDQGKFEMAEAVLSECLERRMKILGSHHSDTLHTMERLATVYAGMNLNAKAESFYERIIELFENRYGSNHVNGLIYSTNLVKLYKDTKQTEKALKLCQEITPKYLGEYDKASSLFQAILESVEKGDGIDTTTSLEVMHYLAETLQSQGQLDQSIAMHKDCLARTRKLLGDNHANTLAFVHAIGLSYFNLGKYEEALPYLLENCEKKKLLLGKNHMNTLTGMNATGVTLTQLKRYKEAEKILLECLEGRRETLGADHQLTLSTMNALGSLYGKMGRHEDAVHILTDVYKCCMRLFGREDPLTTTAMELLYHAFQQMPKKEEEKEEEKTEEANLDKYNHGLSLYQEGKLEEAAVLMKQYLAEYPEEFENDEPSHLHRFTIIASLLVQTGSLDEADSMLTNAVRLWRIVIERETMENLHPSFLTAFNFLGIVKKLMGDRALANGDRETAAIKYTECVAVFAEAYEGRRKLLGEDAEPTKESLGGMQSAQADLLLLGDPQDLESKFLMVSKLFKLGSLHADALIRGLVAESESLPKYDLMAIRIWMLHADILMHNLETPSRLMATVLFERCIVLLEASVGEMHPLTLEALQKAGQIYLRVQLFDKAHEKFAPLLKRTAVVYGEESEEATSALRFLNTARMGVMTLTGS
ncbi:hypothetical protein BJ741DRAFT_580515 [Chytriomyces cf. hyalinus JEL632]|nr:hypothetical protein BJ741DRAFT_580515 [Chytriomyces cf. hyalinus JEL632]